MCIRDRGKALYVGISNYGAEEAEQAIRILKENKTPCLIHQPRYNMFERQIEEALLPLLETEGVGCIAYSPLAQGCLLYTSAPYGSGHINSTFAMVWEQDGKEVRYILQKVNTDIFKDPVSLMKNIEGVTEFLRNEIIRNGGDPERETLNLVPAKDGKKYYQDNEGNFWRVYIFIENATCYNLVEKPEDFYQSGKAFGHFQRLLALSLIHI